MSQPYKNTDKQQEQYRIVGNFNINDIKFDLLKIIHPYDGYMYNEKDTNQVVRLFRAYLSDLRYSNKIFSYDVQSSEKDNAVTFDVFVTMQRERSAKKLKIHVGKLEYQARVA
jgi:hypothetical protein